MILREIRIYPQEKDWKLEIYIGDDEIPMEKIVPGDDLLVELHTILMGLGEEMRKMVKETSN